ncbi:putative cytochrome P450 2U1 [Apostichopus japonicus]|uniref:Putative cytochrome P450 2U1 n=1 Tax=Stichopus japonicus TaxID=307972 RepID=A0A2G8KUQ9_STIJA|nr:putative cytochrome P450 2U1 [Apostichopus japonicus]
MAIDILLSHLYFNLQTLLLFGVVFLTAIWWMSGPKNLPPGPTPLPIIGNLFHFFGKKNYKVFYEIFQNYGGICTVYLGRARTILITDINIVKETATKQADNFSDRFLPPILAWTVGSDGSLFFQNGPVWKERRKFTMQALRNFGVGKKSLEYKINEEARCLMDVMTGIEGPFDPSEYTTLTIANVICNINFGKRFDYKDKHFQDIINRFRFLIASVSLTGLPNSFPFLLRTPLYSHIGRSLDYMKAYIGGHLKEHQQTLNEDDVRDYIDMYLLEIKRQQESGEEVIFKPEQAWRAIMEIFGGGTDTTTNTLLYGILLTSLHTEVQDKVQEEIDRVIGTNRQPSYEDRTNMPYTEAVLMEIQRFRPVVVIVPPHGVFHDTQLAGYNIPKGSQIFVNLWGIFHDPKVWKNPDQFDPTHFLSDDGKTLNRREELIPFGIGRRSCVGEHLAKMELFLFFTNLMQRFKFSLPDEDPIPCLDPDVSVLARPAKFRVCVAQR